MELPQKNIAIALLFSVILGPVGLLYASFWGGVVMIAVGVIVFSAKYIFSIILFWVLCSIWAVGAANRYNKKLVK